MPLILTLDTTGPQCAVALLEGRKALTSKAEAMTKGQAERLFPMTDEVLEEASRTYQDVDAIAVATGPGNFTGVRICVSAARGLALSLGIPAIGVTTLEALAYGHKGRVLAILDARADHVYAQLFDSAYMPQDPIHIPRDAVSRSFHAIEACVGYAADDIALELGAKCLGTQRPQAHTYGEIAHTRDWSGKARPSPLYLRSPDAALPSEPAPRIIS